MEIASCPPSVWSRILHAVVLSGGTVGGLGASKDGQVTMDGGTVSLYVTAHDFSKILLNLANAAGDAVVNDSSTLTLSRGLS